MAPIPSAWQCPLLTPAQCRSFLSQTNSRDKIASQSWCILVPTVLQGFEFVPQG